MKLNFRNKQNDLRKDKTFSKTKKISQLINFESERNSIRYSKNVTLDKINQFYKTIGSNEIGNQWIRPTSKQGNRINLIRPDTSKSIRTTTKVKNNNIRKSGQIEDYLYNKKNQKSIMQINVEPDIVMNKKAIHHQRIIKNNKRSIHRNEFDTTIDQEFLNLFAD